MSSIDCFFSNLGPDILNWVKESPAANIKFDKIDLKLIVIKKLAQPQIEECSFSIDQVRVPAVFNRFLDTPTSKTQESNAEYKKLLSNFLQSYQANDCLRKEQIREFLSALRNPEVKIDRTVGVVIHSLSAFKESLSFTDIKDGVYSACDLMAQKVNQFVLDNGFSYALKAELSLYESSNKNKPVLVKAHHASDNATDCEREKLGNFEEYGFEEDPSEEVSQKSSPRETDKTHEGK